MEGRERSGFLDWLVYGFGLLSVIVLAYLFIGRYNSKIVVSEGEKMMETMVKEEVPVNKEVLPSVPPLPDTTTVNTENSEEAPVAKKENLVKETPPEKPKEISIIPRPKKGKDSTPKISPKPKKDISEPARTCVKKGHKTYYICVPPKKDTRGFKRFAKPIKVSSKDYNWRVLKRFHKVPTSKLWKVGVYKVRKGDTIYTISRRFNVQDVDVMAVNKNITNPDKLEVGKNIIIPSLKGSA